MKLLALISLATNVLVSSLVGLRLLGLGRRTGQLPELLLGLGLCCTGLVGQPLAALGRAPGWIGSPAGDGLFAVGVAIAHAGLALIAVFTWLVFRRSSRLAALATMLLCLAFAALCLGLVIAGTGVDDIRAAVPRTRAFAIGSIALCAVVFAWNGVESLRYHLLLERRLALGLADPVVVDRFRLWAAVGFSTTLMCGVLAVCMWRGLSPLTESLPLTLMATGGGVAALAWYLSFLPPRGYLARLQRRAPQRRTA